jgi:hypothetical protein
MYIIVSVIVMLHTIHTVGFLANYRSLILGYVELMTSIREINSGIN